MISVKFETCLRSTLFFIVAFRYNLEDYTVKLSYNEQLGIYVLYSLICALKWPIWLKICSL